MFSLFKNKVRIDNKVTLKEFADTRRIYLQKSYDEQKKEFNRSVVW